MEDLNLLVDLVVKEGASDLHLADGEVPIVRAAGKLVPLQKYKPFTKEMLDDIVQNILSEARRKTFVTDQSADFAYAHSGARFRCHVFTVQGRTCIAMRHISTKIPTLAELRLPPAIEHVSKLKSGFFLVVGPTGNGKSTTLAAIINMINNERLENIITIEDPIEYVFPKAKSNIHQREVGVDTPSFRTALHDAFRADINVLMVGEMRDPDTMATTITAAETGHLVFSTAHTNSASQTVDRIIDAFESNQQNQIRSQLAASLTGIFSQRLVPGVSGELVPVYELLVNNAAVANLIREKRIHEINLLIETGQDLGMIDFNRCLVERVGSGLISIETAYLYSNNPHALQKLL